MRRTVSIIGGGGVRTPLLIHGMLRAQSQLNIGSMRLFDVDRKRTELMAGLGREIARVLDTDVEIDARESIESAVEGSDFVLSSLRIGGMAARARDERGHHLQSRRIHQRYAIAPLEASFVEHVLGEETGPRIK